MHSYTGGKKKGDLSIFPSVFLVFSFSLGCTLQFLAGNDNRVYKKRNVSIFLCVGGDEKERKGTFNYFSVVRHAT